MLNLSPSNLPESQGI